LVNISREEWLKIKKQGLFLYIVLHWLILAALPAALIFALLGWILAGATLSYFASGTFFTRLVGAYVLCTTLSLIIGFTRWFKYERLYRL